MTEKGEMIMTELEKLKKYLDDNGYDCEMLNHSDNPHYFSKPRNEPDQIIVYGPGHKRSWDVVCHDFSYGGPDGLLELYGDLCTDVIGWLTADDVIKIIENNKKNGGIPIDSMDDIKED